MIRARRRAALILPALLLGACQGSTLKITTTGLPESADDYGFREVSGEIWCEEGENFRTCILEIHGDDLPPSGEARSLTLHLPPAAGAADLTQVPTGLLPVAYAHTDDVLGEKPTFDWICVYERGEITLATDPTPGAFVEGDVDVVLTCEEVLSGRTEEDVTLVGTFKVMVEGVSP